MLATSPTRAARSLWTIVCGTGSGSYCGSKNQDICKSDHDHQEVQKKHAYNFDVLGGYEAQTLTFLTFECLRNEILN